MAAYLRLQYPHLLYHFDLAGLNLSRAQAGMMKAIQHSRGWPDLFIPGKSAMGIYRGLFLELKAEGITLTRRDGTYKDNHLTDQAEVLKQLNNMGYYATFACGFDKAKEIIDWYITGRKITLKTMMENYWPLRILR